MGEAKRRKALGLGPREPVKRDMRVVRLGEIEYDLNAAKVSCHRCHGTGVQGVRVVDKERTGLVCPCVPGVKVESRQVEAVGA